MFEAEKALDDLTQFVHETFLHFDTSLIRINPH